MMVGGTLQDPRAHASPAGEVALEVRGCPPRRRAVHGTALKDVTFAVARARCWASAASPGTGRTNCSLALSGEMRTRPGMVRLKGEPDRPRSVPTRGAPCGLLCAPEERNGHAVGPGDDA